MEVIDLPLAGAKLIRPRIFKDARGFFLESYSEPKYRAAGVDEIWVQDNHSLSARDTLRGLHYQSQPGQAKLVRVTRGRVFDVIVDLRRSAASFGQWYGVQLDAETHAQLYVPVGFAHGFCVLSDIAEVQYKVSSLYDPATECGLMWNDPDLGVTWPVSEPQLSARDQSAETFADFKARLRQGGE